jgi:hypothetical protein
MPMELAQLRKCVIGRDDEFALIVFPRILAVIGTTSAVIDRRGEQLDFAGQVADLLHQALTGPLTRDEAPAQECMAMRGIAFAE